MPDARPSIREASEPTASDRRMVAKPDRQDPPVGAAVRACPAGGRQLPHRFLRQHGQRVAGPPACGPAAGPGPAGAGSPGGGRHPRHHRGGLGGAPVVDGARPDRSAGVGCADVGAGGRVDPGLCALGRRAGAARPAGSAWVEPAGAVRLAGLSRGPGDAGRHHGGDRAAGRGVERRIPDVLRQAVRGGGDHPAAGGGLARGPAIVPARPGRRLGVAAGADRRPGPEPVGFAGGAWRTGGPARGGADGLPLRPVRGAGLVRPAAAPAAVDAGAVGGAVLPGAGGVRERRLRQYRTGAVQPAAPGCGGEHPAAGHAVPVGDQPRPA